jgi:hypothetical protein
VGFPVNLHPRGMGAKRFKDGVNRFALMAQRHALAQWRPKGEARLRVHGHIGADQDGQRADGTRRLGTGHQHGQIARDQAGIHISARKARVA